MKCEGCGACLGTLTRHGTVRPNAITAVYIILDDPRPVAVLTCPVCQKRRYVRGANVEIRPIGEGTMPRKPSPKPKPKPKPPVRIGQTPLEGQQ